MASTYLTVAREVLLTKRTPMSARDILDYAHANRLLPARLYGATQWKTIQARLSEEIRLRGESSPFVRTDSGVFFLRELLDANAEDKPLRVFTARPRVLDLSAGRMLTVHRSFLEPWQHNIAPINDLIDTLRNHGRFLTQREIEGDPDTLKVNTFVVVTRGRQVLTYRVGRYRSQRDTIALERSIGFESPVREFDHDLLDVDRMGIVNSGLREIAAVLGMNSHIVRITLRDGLLTPISILHHTDPNDLATLHAILVYKCPTRFEPTTRRLAINDLRWDSMLENANNLGDIEPISRALLNADIIRDIVEAAAN